jgi:hypothetical protein
METVVVGSSAFNFKQRIRRLFSNGLRVDSAIYRMIGSINPGHRSYFIQSRVSSFYIAIDKCSVLLKAQPPIVIQLSNNKFVASVLHTLAPELLQAGEL